MSQHDMEIANANFPAVRTDINNALPALASRSSGATAPATTFAHQEWMDTTSGFRKIRNAANSAWVLAEPITSPLVAPVGIFGNTLSNNVTDATNDIDIAAGACADATLAAWLVGAALTKRLDAAWAVGTNQGMLDTGSIANATYHIFRIMRSDTGVVDILASTSATAPTMPSNYDYKRRIGSIVRTGGAIKPFLQTGDRFEWKTPVQDVVAAANTAVTARTLTVPTGIKVEALITVAGIGSVNANLFVGDPDLGSIAASSTNRTLFIDANLASGASVHLACLTNTSAQVNTDGDGGSSTVTISTFGYIDGRRI